MSHEDDSTVLEGQLCFGDVSRDFRRKMETKYVCWKGIDRVQLGKEIDCPVVDVCAIIRQAKRSLLKWKKES